LDSPAALAHIEALLQKAAATDPHFDLANLQLGNIYFAQGALPEALSAYQTAVATNPSNSDAHYRLGLSYKRLGQETNAEREFREYKRLDETETARIDRQRREVRQFLFVLKDQAQP
jgi:tetratricopeptide (TPR) repeat protein